MENNKSLRAWAREKKIWTKKAWVDFVNDYLEPLYVDLWNLGRFYDFLGELDGKKISELDDELKEKIKVALYGGVGKVQDEKTFAKYMFDHFGLKVSGSETFKDSINSYRHHMGNLNDVKLEVDEKKNKGHRTTEYLLKLFIKKINIEQPQLKMIEINGNPKNMELSEIEIEPKKEYKKNPEDLLPNLEGTPNELITLRKNRRKHSSELAIGKNPYTTFVWYIRFVHPDYLRNFLGCTIDELRSLTEFLDMAVVDAYTFEDTKINRGTIRRTFILIPSESHHELDFNDKFFRFWRYHPNTISGGILNISTSNKINAAGIMNLDIDDLYSDKYAKDLLEFIKMDDNLSYIKYSNNGAFVEVLRNSGKVNVYMVRYKNNTFGGGMLPTLEYRFIDLVPTLQKMCHIGLCRTIYIAQKQASAVRIGIIFNNRYLSEIIRRRGGKKYGGRT